MNPSNFRALLRTLSEHGVEFIVAGGVAAVLQGAPVLTFDLDVVHRRTEENVRRLLGALERLEACYRTQPERRLRPEASHLMSAGHQLLITRFGPLDLLGTVGVGETYEDLEKESAAMDVGEGVKVKVLELGPLIRVKEATADDKDRAMLPVLKRTLEERGRQGQRRSSWAPGEDSK